MATNPTQSLRAALESMKRQNACGFVLECEDEVYVFYPFRYLFEAFLTGAGQATRYEEATITAAVNAMIKLIDAGFDRLTKKSKLDVLFMQTAGERYRFKQEQDRALSKCKEKDQRIAELEAELTKRPSTEEHKQVLDRNQELYDEVRTLEEEIAELNSRLASATEPKSDLS